MAGERVKGEPRRYRLADATALCSLPLLAACLTLLPAAAATAAPAYPQCPYACGDTPDLFCNYTHPIPAGHSIHAELRAGLGESDGWDIRVWQADADLHPGSAPKFRVLILDDDDFEKFEKNMADPTVKGCRKVKTLNKDVTCFSLQTNKCKKFKNQTGTYDYRHVIIQSLEDLVLLRWHIDAIFMPEVPCWWGGLPCGYWTALLWLLLLAGLGTAAFLYRDVLFDFASKVPVPENLKEGCSKFLGGPWRIFSGRSFGVEEMEARLAERGEGLGSTDNGPSILSDGLSLTAVFRPPALSPLCLPARGFCANSSPSQAHCRRRWLRVSLLLLLRWHLRHSIRTVGVGRGVGSADSHC